MVETHRNTRQRRAVGAILDDLDAFASAQEIHDILQQRGEKVGLSTVYRNLQALVDAAEVDALRGADGEVRYRQCSAGHHHHLVCRNCGRTVEVVEDGADGSTLSGVAVCLDHDSSSSRRQIVAGRRRRATAPARAAAPNPARASTTMVGPGWALIS